MLTEIYMHSAVQRQLYFRNLKSPHAFANAYTQDQAEHTVIVSNLSEETNADDVRAFFAEVNPTYLPS